MEHNRNIINMHSKKEMRSKHEKNEKWKNYAQRAQKHPYVRNYLMEKYKNICQYCGMPIIKSLQLQHVTYDKECVTGDVIVVSHKTPKRPNGTRKVPDCEHCDKFHDCIDGSLFPVHGYCNMLINRETYKIKRNIGI